MRNASLLVMSFGVLGIVAFSQSALSQRAFSQGRSAETGSPRKTATRSGEKTGTDATSAPRKSSGEKSTTEKSRNAAESAKSEKRDAKPQTEKGAAREKETNVGPEREAAAVTFAELNHPELMMVVRPLKEQNPREYQRAVRELFRTSERLNQVREHNLPRYKLELEDWKLSSRIRLRAARFAMSNDPTLEVELRELIAQHLEIRVQLLELQRSQLQERLDRLDRVISETKNSQDQQADLRLNKLLKSLNATRNNAKRDNEKKAVRSNEESP